ncbi:alpha/beta fold hydrolase [Actinokineospora bangkokensis]|uniref:Alpha/beta hydrolase n=1 Tax=Actinokineospora bangkokensis TaxID=1193682 RepID=A0A1Q9LNE9_9PSEU|nr:alpha/beta fold hydrolase [Actinokineospora bangkokensis]OLR93550.1 alpha/beta hydrolase [Actinokineospora bangkokensis]
MSAHRSVFVSAPDGTRLAVQPTGDGQPLLLLAGQSNNHTWWDRVRPDFEPHRRVITLDWRGTGRSGAPDEPYSTPGFAEDLVAVLDALEVDEADVYGTSMGGRVAQWLAARHPRRVRKLVLGCTTPGGAHAVERSNDIRRALAKPDHAQALIDLMYTPGWCERNPGPYAVLGDPGLTAHARVHHLKASNNHDAWDVLPDIAAPTLVLHGSDDLMAPVANARLLAERIPGAVAHVFPGARHAYFDECAPEASRVVLDFLG